jgi:hypothetical protein
MQFPLRATSAAAALGATALLGLAAFQPVAARESCSNRTVEGEFALLAQGQTEDLQHTTANLGRIVADGRGGLSGSLTLSVNGQIVRGQRVSGTYVVNPDCTGTEQFTIGTDPNVRSADFVVANHGSEIQFLETDSGTVFSGTATRQ